MNEHTFQDSFDERAVRRSFDRAGESYDAAAVLQRQVRDDFLERLSLTTLKPRAILDAGAGTAHSSRALAQRYRDARVIALDNAPGMLHEARHQLGWRRKFDRVCADAHYLPLPDAAFDLVFSNLMLQWCDPETVLPEFRRVLAPHGLLALTTFGPDTLKELRAAWAAADPRHEHVMPFIDMHDLGDALVRAGFSSPVLDVDHFMLSYADVRALMKDLKAIGAHNAHSQRARGLTGKTTFAAMLAGYEKFRAEGRLPATYEVIFAHAWAPQASSQPASGVEQGISLSELRAELARAKRGADPKGSL